MSTHPWLERTAVVSLGLTVLLLADGASVLPGGTTWAASDNETETAASSADAIVCTPGFGDTHSREDMALHGVTLTRDGALAVGFSRRRSANNMGRRQPAAIHNPSGRWTRTFPVRICAWSSAAT